jgi:anti-anti-sigma factor
MLKVHAQKVEDVGLLRLWGRIAIGETDILRRAVFCHADVREVILDLARVSGIDASGLGVLLELREHLQLQGIGFRLMNIPNLVLQVFEIARLDTVFAFSDLDVVSERPRRKPPEIDTGSGAWSVS